MTYTIDAQGKRLGRLAAEIAVILQDKKNASYEPRFEGKDQVVVKNIDKMTVGGRKMEQKKFYRHTTQIGHLKEKTLAMMWEQRGPAWVLRHSVLGMLPKNRLQAKRIKRLIIE